MKKVIDEMIEYNGKTITFEEYEHIQKKLWDEMIERTKESKQNNNASVLTPTQKYGVKNPVLSAEASQCLLLGIAGLFLSKLSK